MPSIYSSDGALRIYYGRGAVAVLAQHRRVALQVGHHDRAELASLVATGTDTLAYLSLSEDTGPAADWHRRERNPHWGGHYVVVAHPGWQRRTLDLTERALERGFTGLFLDTLDLPHDDPSERAALVELVGSLRRVAGRGYVLANRGFDVIERVAPLVDGFVFESFSTTWEDGYRALSPRELLSNTGILGALAATGRDLYALDYAVTPSLAAFARGRAGTHGLPSQVSNRDLTWLDSGTPPASTVSLPSPRRRPRSSGS